MCRTYLREREEKRDDEKPKDWIDELLYLGIGETAKYYLRKLEAKEDEIRTLV